MRSLGHVLGIEALEDILLRASATTQTGDVSMLIVGQPLQWAFAAQLARGAQIVWHEGGRLVRGEVIQLRVDTDGNLAVTFAWMAREEEGAWHVVSHVPCATPMPVMAGPEFGRLPVVASDTELTFMTLSGLARIHMPGSAGYLPRSILYGLPSHTITITTNAEGVSALGRLCKLLTTPFAITDNASGEQVSLENLRS